MSEFLSFFEQLSSVQKLSWVIVCMAFFWILEGAIPLVSFRYKKWKHAKVNLVLLGSTILINVVFGILAAGVFAWVADTEVGLLHLFDGPIWLELLVGVLLLDAIAQYGVHYLLHKYKSLWRLHMVHHSDTHVDVTTGTRHHPGDYVFRELFSLLAVVVGGIPFSFYMIYRITTVICTYFTHANIRLPLWLDKGLSYVIVTPNMHKFHHHFERPWTDANFGNIFSVWDRMFGTFVYADPDDIHYGLDVLDDTTSEDLIYQIKLPFDRSVAVDE